MLDGVIRWVAVVATGIVVASFGLFAIDQMAGASRQQQQSLEEAGSTPVPVSTGGSERSGVAASIDRAAAALLSPFSGLATSDDPWVTRGVPTLLGLLVYGLGLGFLARLVRQRA